MRSLFCTFILVLLLLDCGHTQDSLKNYSVSLSVLLDSLSIPEEGIHVEIDKRDYVLSIVRDTIIIKQYPVVFGSDPLRDKLRQGDRRTPEGKFKVISKYPHQRWDRFIWINYPTEDSWKKHRQAKMDGLIEESDGIGGEIGIHGVPWNTDYMIDERMNWTLGCISLKNDDINDFFPHIQKGSIVIIEK